MPFSFSGFFSSKKTYSFEVPTTAVDAAVFLDEFKSVYEAMYQGETTVFKKAKKNFDEMSVEQIQNYALNNPDSRTAKAWKILQNSSLRGEGISKKAYLFQEVHTYCVSHSGWFSWTKNKLHSLPGSSIFNPYGNRSRLIKEILDMKWPEKISDLSPLPPPALPPVQPRLELLRGGTKKQLSVFYKPEHPNSGDRSHLTPELQAQLLGDSSRPPKTILETIQEFEVQAAEIDRMLIENGKVLNAHAVEATTSADDQEAACADMERRLNHLNNELAELNSCTIL